MGAEAIQHLSETTAATNARKRRQAASGRQVKRGGVIYASEVRSMRQEEDREKREKKEAIDARKLLVYIEKLPAEQRQAFMEEMAQHDVEEAARIEAKLLERKQRIARRRAETRRRRSEEAQRKLEEESTGGSEDD